MQSPEHFIFKDTADEHVDMLLESSSCPCLHVEVSDQPNNNQRSRISKRKGKRQQVSRYQLDLSNTKRLEQHASGADHFFHCTVCTKFFKDMYGWRRHEAGVHTFHTVGRICMLNGHSADGNSCAFCSELDPDPSHMDQHSISTCLHKPLDERTFYREDHLKQHIVQVHLTDMESSAKRAFKVPRSWARDVDADGSDTRSLWCGFCRETFASTAKRMDHVAEHFRSGMSMNHWSPCS